MSIEINYEAGDLFDIESKIKHPLVIAHVCNNVGAWGAGFVVPLGRKYPLAKNEYISWSHSSLVVHEENIIFENMFDLGSIQVVKVSDRVCVANMVAQELGGYRPLYYNHLCTCMDAVADLIKDEILPNYIIAPQFGSGLAGGNWNIIKQLIHDSWCRREINVTVVKYDR